MEFLAGFFDMGKGFKNLFERSSERILNSANCSLGQVFCKKNALFLTNIKKFKGGD